MKNIVIAGSASLQEDIQEWIKYFESINYKILDYPKAIEKEVFLEVYPNIYIEFFANIKKTDVFFLMNEDKNGIDGYIGAESFSELGFAVTQNLLENKNIKIYILKEPSKEVKCYDEINLWLKLGWISIYEK